MKYPLQDILRVRVMRENRAQTELAVAHQSRREAERIKQEKTERRAAYERTREGRRDKVFNAVVGRIVRRDDLEMARETVREIDEEGVLLREDENKAADVVRQRLEAERTARAVFIGATRAHAKIEEHRMLWNDAERRRLEVLEDLELEEFGMVRKKENES